jgi:hypothetical protein
MAMREGYVPEFREADISERISKPESAFTSQGFDLIYCRNVLWQVAQRGEASLQSACYNIMECLERLF